MNPNDFVNSRIIKSSLLLILWPHKYINLTYTKMKIIIKEDDLCIVSC